MRYKGKVYRPPSEAYSLIVQVTYGCSHNRCAFCDMYDDKHFALRPMEEIREDFRLARQVYRRVERVFLADGDDAENPGPAGDSGHGVQPVSGVPAGDVLRLAPEPAGENR